MRQHVNPLSRFFQLPLELPSPKQLFKNPDLPIHLDIGTARGKFLLEMADLYPQSNYLGVEIRKPLVEAAERDREQLGLENLKYIFCNANVSLQNWLLDLPKNQLETVSIQFPDPWFKRRHQKRQVLQNSLLIAIAASLAPNCMLFIQSDVLIVVEQMTKIVSNCSYFELSKDCNQGWSCPSPFLVRTEREAYAFGKNLPIYRAIYKRNNKGLD